jgi:HEAT repeat protein
MKKNDISEIDTILIGSPEKLINLIKVSLDTKNITKKLSSRKTLVRLGKRILPQMHKLLRAKNVLIRMEAAKIMELIGNRMSIQVFIDLLDDSEFDIRWIAAEGLIKIGRRSIQPILKSVRDGESSIIHNEGAHHVLIALLNDNEKQKEMTLLQSLENYHALGGTAPIEALTALETTRTGNILH